MKAKICTIVVGDARARGGQKSRSETTPDICSDIDVFFDGCALRGRSAMPCFGLLSVKTMLKSRASGGFGMRDVYISVESRRNTQKSTAAERGNRSHCGAKESVPMRATRG